MKGGKEGKRRRERREGREGRAGCGWQALKGTESPLEGAEGKHREDSVMWVSSQLRGVRGARGASGCRGRAGIRKED